MINPELAKKVSRLRAMYRDDRRLGSDSDRWLVEIRSLALNAQKIGITEEYRWLCIQYHKTRKMSR